MKLKHLKEENLKFALTPTSNANTLNQALKLYTDKNFEDLEHLLMAEWQVAQDKAVLLQKMFSEVANYNLLTGLNEG